MCDTSADVTDSTPQEPAASMGQVVFVKKADTLSIPQIFKFVDSTAIVDAGFQSAFIYRQVSNPSMYSVYETRTGTREAFLRNIEQADLRDVLMLRRNVEHASLRDLLNSSVDWYNPIARRENRPDSSRRHETSLIRVMQLKPGREAREDVLKELYKLIEVVLRTQPALKTSVVHESVDNPDKIMLYEEWNCSKEKIIGEELPKSYRTSFRKLTDPHFVSKRDLEWLTPLIKVEMRFGRIEKTVL
jgi:quinol monooxygenase YgiN